MKIFPQEKAAEKRFKNNNFKDLLIFLLLYTFACVSWYVIYVQAFLDFWFALAASYWVLGTISMQYYGFPFKNEDISFKSLGLGILLGLLLYAASFLGLRILEYLLPHIAHLEYAHLFDFSQEKEKLYTLKEGKPIWLISFVLIFITSPYEEIFWRGYLQNMFSSKFSAKWGILLSTLLYSAMQISTGSLLLIFIAFLAGIYWASIYHYTKNLLVCIISHAIWVLCAYILIPLI